MDVRANKRQGTNQPVVMDVNIETGRKLIWDPAGYLYIISSVRSSNSHPDLLVIQQQQHPLFQITPVLNTGLSLSEPLQLYKGYNAI